MFAPLQRRWCAKAFVINPQLFAGKGSVPTESTDYVWTLVALALTGLYYLAYVRLACRPKAAEIIFGSCFGILNYFGTTLFAYDSWAFIGVFQSWPTVILKCVCQGVTMATPARPCGASAANRARAARAASNTRLASSPSRRLCAKDGAGFHAAVSPVLVALP